jgi:phosphatidylglycerophosphatase C
MTAAVPAARAVAAFDFDGTLTWHDSLLPFLRQSLGWPRFLAAMLRASPWLAGYGLGLVPNDIAKSKLLRYSLGGRTTAQVAAWAHAFCSHSLPAMLRPAAIAKLRAHQAAGDICVLVSASPGIYMHTIGAQLGFDAVLCTELAVQSDALTGAMATPNCFGPQKVLRLQAWLAEQHMCAKPLSAYGDSRGDRELLALADHASYRGRSVAK